MKFIRKNWFKLIIVFVSIVGILWISRACSDAIYEKKIGKLDDEIIELNKKNFKLEGEIFKSIENAEKDAETIKEFKVVIADSKSKIEELKKEEAKVETIVAGLLPSQLVEDTRTILECVAVELTANGILLSEVCARLNLVKLKGFSLIKQQLDETAFALSVAEEALHFSERRSWSLYGALMNYSKLVINYKKIAKNLDKKYELAEKQKKKSWFHGLFIGFALGAGITVIIVIIIPLIKLLI